METSKDGQDFLCDSVNVAQILALVSPDYVSKALSIASKHDQRERDLPARLIIYFPILLGVFMDLPYKEVFQRLQGAFNWLGLDIPRKSPTPAALSLARQRLGYEPLQMLFEQTVSRQCRPESRAAYYKDLLLTAIDGCVIDVEDSEANAIFGFPKNAAGEGAYPQVRCVMMVNHYTRTLADIGIGTVGGSSEHVVAKPLLSRLQPGTLNIADRLYYSFENWETASATGAQLLWRARSDISLRPVEVFKDGSYLAHVYKYDGKHKRVYKIDENGERVAESVIVRVIEYGLEGGTETYKLMTTLLDPLLAPAEDLARLYPSRYAANEGFNKEIKDVLRSPRIVLRSKSPPMVIQELYGLLLAHHAIRSLMVQAVEHRDLAPTDISFKHAVLVIRRHLTKVGSFSP